MPEKAPPRRGPAKKPKVTMMEQFWSAKRDQPDALLFFRMGDFYELFGDDAKVASRELGIALTARNKDADALPMAGVPVRAMEGYLMRLVKKGFKVAICEQMQDPRSVKGIVERQVVRVVTAGTITEEEALDARANNFLASLFVDKEGRAGLAWLDVSTGRFLATETDADGVDDELSRVSPAELLVSEGIAAGHPALFGRLGADYGARLSQREPWRFERESCTRVLQRQLGVATLEGYGFEDGSPVVSAAGALVEYLEETQRGACSHVQSLERVDGREHLVLDRATRSCLELLETQRDGRREGTLLDTIDATRTPMGGRLLREWVLAPLREVDAILYRQQGVAELVGAPFQREELRALLGDVLDIERLVAKVSTGRANARDLRGLAGSLAVAAPLRTKLEAAYSKLLGDLYERIDPLEELVSRIEETLVDAPPITLKDGGLIRAGVDPELDELRQIAGDGKAWIARFQADEAERTGIANLKIGFNSVFGYYIEVPRGQVARVPEGYVRKQTIKTAERYVTPELKTFEDKVLRAEERAQDMEYALFNTLKESALAEVPRILETARALALVDCIAGLAETAARRRYVAPSVDQGDALKIVDGRHPVIEVIQTSDAFVPNDSSLDRSGRMLGLITGPNMAGKSTYIRQTALIVLLAQIGSFVPAKEAKIGVVDRIFTRIGSGDDIGRGASTFMVEMIEIANILNNASPRSLLILDEVGRGTSTFDGLALAWAIVEHIHEKIRARTLFATHYHQLTELSERLGGVFNLSVAVREFQDEIVFLHRIVEGGTDRSYGIQVARLAGVPHELLERAKEVLAEIEHDGGSTQGSGLPPRVIETRGGQLALFAEPPPAPEPTPLEQALAQIDVDVTTPLEALQALARLKDLLP